MFGQKVAPEETSLGRHNKGNNMIYSQYLTSFELKCSSTDSFVAVSLLCFILYKKKSHGNQEPCPALPSIGRALTEGGLRNRCHVQLKMHPPKRSLAGQFAVEARQTDGEGLQGTHGVVVVQSEDVFRHSAELHDDVIGYRAERQTSISTGSPPGGSREQAARRNSRSLSCTIWKFLTEAWVTRPWKFSTYDCVSSFHTGALLCSSIRLSRE